jgi:hypothetical protein
MAHISFVHPDDITDPEMRSWLQEAIETGIPGPENQAIRAHHKAVMRSFTMLGKTMRAEGVLEPELRELMRARMATSWGPMFGTDCHY